MGLAVLPVSITVLWLRGGLRVVEIHGDHFSCVASLHLNGLVGVFVVIGVFGSSRVVRHEPGQCVDSITALSSLVTGHWADVCRGALQATEVRGDHFSRMVSPHVAELAAVMSEYSS